MLVRVPRCGTSYIDRMPSGCFFVFYCFSLFQRLMHLARVVVVKVARWYVINLTGSIN